MSKRFIKIEKTGRNQYQVFGWLKDVPGEHPNGRYFKVESGGFPTKEEAEEKGIPPIREYLKKWQAKVDG
jgi:hypothetical protein